MHNANILIVPGESFEQRWKFPGEDFSDAVTVVFVPSIGVSPVKATGDEIRMVIPQEITAVVTRQMAISVRVAKGGRTTMLVNGLLVPGESHAEQPDVREFAPTKPLPQYEWSRTPTKGNKRQPRRRSKPE